MTRIHRPTRKLYELSASARTELNASTMDERIEQAIEVLRRRLGAKWATPVVRMVTGGTATRYALVHFTNRMTDGIL
jgi:hypothetical protein